MPVPTASARPRASRGRRSKRPSYREAAERSSKRARFSGCSNFVVTVTHWQMLPPTLPPQGCTSDRMAERQTLDEHHVSQRTTVWEALSLIMSRTLLAWPPRLVRVSPIHAKTIRGVDFCKESTQFQSAHFSSSLAASGNADGVLTHGLL